MNAAEIITKPARALVVASGLIAATSIIGFAQDITVNMGAVANYPITNPYLNPPAGIVTLGGHQFDLTSGNMILLTNGQSASISGSYPNTTSTYFLINSFATYTASQPVGQIVLTFSDGTTQTITLTSGSNVREWRPGVNTVNTASDPALANVWTGEAQAAAGGGTAIIDMLTIQVANKTLTNITISVDNPYGIGIIVPAVTVDPVATPACIRPGNSINSTNACEHSQAALHSQSANFTSTPTAAGQLAKIDGTPANTNNPANASDKGKGHQPNGHKSQ
jgi:hypothetical protein